MKIIFMGTPKFATPSLEKLYEEGIDISLVITQRDKPKGRGRKLLPTPVKEKALELELEVYQPENVNSKETIEVIRNISPDCIVVAAYGQILKEELLSIPKYGCINIHSSLLPKYRGAAPINWAVINGEKETGITIMEMGKGLDSGDILLQKSLNIEEDDDSETLTDKLSFLGSELIAEVLNNIEVSKKNKKPQGHYDSFYYAPMLKKDLGRINWNQQRINIRNLVRGLKPWPIAYTYYKNEPMKIYKASADDTMSEGNNGQIVRADNSGIYVKCEDGVIIIEELQFPGRRRTNVREYLKGNKMEIGAQLN